MARKRYWDEDALELFRENDGYLLSGMEFVRVRIHNPHLTVAANAITERKTMGHRSEWDATRL